MQARQRQREPQGRSRRWRFPRRKLRRLQGAVFTRILVAGGQVCPLGTDIAHARGVAAIVPVGCASGHGKWLRINILYSQIWSNIRAKGEPPAERELFAGETPKFEKYVIGAAPTPPLYVKGRSRRAGTTSARRNG